MKGFVYFYFWIPFIWREKTSKLALKIDVILCPCFDLSLNQEFLGKFEFIVDSNKKSN